MSGIMNTTKKIKRNKLSDFQVCRLETKDNIELEMIKQLEQQYYILSSKLYISEYIIGIPIEDRPSETPCMIEVKGKEFAVKF